MYEFERKIQTKNKNTCDFPAQNYKHSNYEQIFSMIL